MSRGVRFHLEGNSDMPTISESDTDDNGTDTESSNETIGDNQHKLSANDYHKYDNQAFERELDHLAETAESQPKPNANKVRFFQSASESHPTGAMGGQNLDQDSGSRVDSPVEEEPEQTDVSSIVADIMAAPGTNKDSHSPVTLRDKAQARTLTRQNTKVPRQLLIELFDRVRIPVQLESSKSNKDLNLGPALNNTQTHTWQQTARFMKYEEDAVGIDQHFGKAHVPFLTLKSLMQLKKLISQGVVLLDVDCDSFESIISTIRDAMSRHYNMDDRRCQAIFDTLHERNRHVHEDTGHSASTQLLRKLTVSANLDRVGSMSNIFGHQNSTSSNWLRKESSMPHSIETLDSSKAVHGLEIDDLEKNLTHRRNTRTSSQLSSMNMPRISSNSDLAWAGRHCTEDTEAAQIYIGELKDLVTGRCAIVRLNRPLHVPELMDVSMPIRFLFVILGPPSVDLDYHEIGRSVSTLMANKTFQQSAYNAHNRMDFLHGLDKYLGGTLVVMPPEDPLDEKMFDAIHITQAMRYTAIKQHAKKNKTAQNGTPAHGHAHDSHLSHENAGKRDPLKKSSSFAGGIISDLKDRLPFYKSDFTDAIRLKLIASTVFLYFAAFAPAVTFGGLMGSYTKDQMGITEMLLSQAVCGVIWHLFSAQPLILQAATGPVLIFEAALFIFCELLNLHFLTIRLWASVWMAVFCVIAAFTEAAVYIKYITRFTEDVFSVLISAIFIFEAIGFIKKSFSEHPIEEIHYYESRKGMCYGNFSELHQTQLLNDKRHPCLRKDQPDTTLLTMAVVLGTFTLAYALRIIRNSVYLGRTMRHAVGDFSLLIAIVIMTMLDKVIFGKVFLKRVDIGQSFGLTSPAQRGWLVPWMLPDNEWGYVFAILPAFLAFILIFLETEVTELLMLQKKLGLQKGNGGHHWDLFVVAIILLIGGIFGLPWMCATAAQSIGHVTSLTVFEPGPPGSVRKVDYVIEQRVTGILCSVIVGLSTFAGPLLRELPMGVLFGVLVYLGITNLQGVQFVNRFILFFIPTKYYPDMPYCQEVSMWHMHCYTLLQLFLFILIYTVKSFKETAMAFPFLVILMVCVREFILPKLLTEKEMHALDAHDEPTHDQLYDVTTVIV